MKSRLARGQGSRAAERTSTPRPRISREQQAGPSRDLHVLRAVAYELRSGGVAGTRRRIYSLLMRIARGKVVGSQIIVDGEPLPEGSTVSIWVDDDGFDLEPATFDELAKADASIERGEGLTVEQLMERLRGIRAA